MLAPARANGSCQLPYTRCKPFVHPQVVIDDIPFPNPYPPGVLLDRITFDIQVVDKGGTPIPLTEVYLHHTIGDVRFSSGEGAETRGSPARIPYPEPYAFIVNGSELVPISSRCELMPELRS